ncbi:MAG TPA: serine/threonine-protein kinase [Kofleriaceae bacterium]|nr:serine/threonine-protein kinase [Kofleriaceae bacterium]
MPPRPSKFLPADTRVGDYLLREAIDSGGYGAVYRAETAIGGEVAAVKVLHEELCATREAVLRFEREVRSIRLIRHPAVIDIRDFGYYLDKRPYFAMELLHGANLRNRVTERGPLAAEAALAVLEPLCAALEAAHKKGVIHRDLKASNVFIADGQEPKRVVLLDFGVAKLLDDTGPALTLTHHAVGSPPCMSPEQIIGDPVDERTDVYGLGLLLFYMLTGALPFEHKQRAIVWDMHLRQPPPLPSHRADVPRAVDKVVVAALAKSPDDRPQTPADLLDRYRAALE